MFTVDGAPLVMDDAYLISIPPQQRPIHTHTHSKKKEKKKEIFIYINIYRRAYILFHVVVSIDVDVSGQRTWIQWRDGWQPMIRLLKKKKDTRGDLIKKTAVASETPLAYKSRHHRRKKEKNVVASSIRAKIGTEGITQIKILKGGK